MLWTNIFLISLLLQLYSCFVIIFFRKKLFSDLVSDCADDKTVTALSKEQYTVTMCVRCKKHDCNWYVPYSVHWSDP
jgi:hypothetical protein